MASLDIEKVKRGLLGIQAVSPYDVSDALILIESQQAQIEEANALLDPFAVDPYFEDCGDPECDECDFERRIRSYREKYRNEQ